MRPRSDSFTTSNTFPSFNSKLLSTLSDNDGTFTAPSPRTNGGAFPEETQKPVLRPAVSSPDIKALFNAPQAPQAYNYIPADPNNSASTNQAGPSPSYQYRQAYQANAPSPALPELHTPRFYSPHGSAVSGHTPSYSISSTFTPSQQTLSSSSSGGNGHNGNIKRESDPMMENKIKDLIRRGALGHHLNARAQSLDISQQTKTFGRHASSSADSEAVSAALSQLRL